MAKCTYCLKELKKGTGMMYVYKSGDVAYYCSSKCFQNHVVMRRKINSKLIAKEVKIAKPAAQKK